MKIIYIFFIFYLIYLNNAQYTLPNDQQDAIDTIMIEIFGTKVDDICSYGSFKCAPINDGVSASNVSTITEIVFPSSSPKMVITSPFTSFINLTILELTNGLSSYTFFNNISNYQYLKKLVISNQIQPIPSDENLPNSLDSVEFGTISTGINENFFSSGKISNLVIINFDSGSSLPSSFPVNSYLKSLSLPISYIQSSFPNDLNNLKALTELNLNIFNDRNSNENYKDFQLPNFQSPFEQLSIISITFINSPIDSTGSNIQTWNFLQSITQIKTLSNLNIYGKGFTLDPSIGLTDFSLLNSSSIFNFEEGCDFLTMCDKKPCLNLPIDSKLSLSNCNVNLNSLSFKNILEFTMVNNDLEQELPWSSESGIDYVKMDSFNVERKNNLVGPLPSSYCQFRDGVLGVGGNLLSGSIPSCFSCSGANSIGTKYLLPNNFTDFNSNSVATNCPTFSFDTSYNKIVKTDGSSIITISGTDFGWYYKSQQQQQQQQSNDSDSELSPTITITIPNKQIELSIPKGTGANKNFVAYFGSNFQFKQVFTYTYNDSINNNSSSDESGEPSSSSIIYFSSFYFITFLVFIQFLF
ncbi:hypothetical protein ACTFIZ_012543 [Dictyostelium cf. discoideum]